MAPDRSTDRSGGELVPLSREARAQPRRWRSRAEEVESALPEVRRRSPPELVDAALEVIAARFWICTGVAVLAWLPIRAGMAALHLADRAGDPEVFLSGGWWLVGVALPGAVRTLVAAAVALIVWSAIERLEVRTGRAIGYVLKRSAALLVIAFAGAAATFVGTCAFIVPGILVSWILYVAPTVLVLEGVGIGRALQRSWELVQGSFWRWLGLVVVGQLLIAPLELVAAAGDNPDTRGPILAALPVSVAVFDAVHTVLASILTGIATAVAAVFVTVFYLDCRIRREGHDLELALDELERAHPAAAPAG